MICKNCQHLDFKHDGNKCIQQVVHCDQCTVMVECACNQYEPKKLQISFTPPTYSISNEIHTFADVLQKCVDEIRTQVAKLPLPMPGHYWIWKNRREGDMIILYDFELVKYT